MDAGATESAGAVEILFMTRSEKRVAAQEKRKNYALWMFKTLKARYDQTNDFTASVTWLENRILDKIKEKPQEQELIVEAAKILKDGFNRESVDVSGSPRAVF